MIASGSDKRGLRFAGLSFDTRESIRYVISDVDDTITFKGKLIPESLEALWRLKNSGKTIILVTGGSAGWADAYIRQWPVDAVIAESGAVLIAHGKDDAIVYSVNPAIDQKTYQEKKGKLLKATAGLSLSSDQYARIFDIAYDKSQLDEYSIRNLRHVLDAMGASYAESSIHINAWFGDYDKKSSLRYFTKQLYAIEEQDLLEHSVYFGDSFNDQVLFSYIPLSIGMHSVEDSRDGFEFLPKYITDGYGGIGFAEACRFIADINPSDETN